MIVIMKPSATMSQVSAVIGLIEEKGYRVHLSEGEERTIVGIIGSGAPINKDPIQLLPGVDRVVPVGKPFKLASREFHPDDTHFPIGNVMIGGHGLAIMAGPCSVESRSQIIETAYAVKEAGAHILRGGAFKPRSSPYSFQGMGEEGLRYMKEASELTGLPIITEVMEPALVPLVCEYADILQIGARNMQNYALLHAVGRSQHPVLLKRGMSSLMEEWLMCAEYILSHGNTRVMLCERGIRTFEKYTRNTFDINAIPVAKHLSHLPVIADPSHATGKWEYVGAAARAAVAAGADGLIIEVHPEPEKAMSDGAQSLKPEKFAALVLEMKAIAQAVGRDIEVSNKVLA
ncbi:MAG: 3-deoxy-7-phosphoheptulonate synthase [Anaerolineae bacterium]|nr:3-deoxy-7-phosphoheptulonate synthase [Anaerolineae bacterium]MCO5192652.1 3-deoxy-7-phosphoheptulonate synthase [Anaerolineae bacterium]MCO5197836.1 3-deoxy-7-phosphoheptulonate synthase [Anaerolineae bacterium]MCO5205332.1 3-deoxy-7-phosphoheptulonate synthase [Anaerolineae bacterium]